MDVYKKHNIVLTAVGVYSYNTQDPEAAKIREQVADIVKAHPHVIQMHGFYVDRVEKTMRFDVVISFDSKDRRQEYQKICEEVSKEYPDYTLQVTMDTDFSEDEIIE